MNIETLVSTMNRSDFGFLREMNVQGKIIVINQCDEDRYERIESDEYSAEIINSRLRGLSNSRNHALLHASGDIVLTTDDDVSYVRNAYKTIEAEFAKHPEADIIAFNIERINSKRVGSRKKHDRWRKAPGHKYYPSVSLAYRLSSMRKANLRFHPFFGAGSRYGSGEESLLLKDARDKGLHIYESPEQIAIVDDAESTWFNGFDEKFFFDKGAWTKATYPRFYWLFKFYFLRLYKKSQLSIMQIMMALNSGVASFDNGTEYKQWNGTK